MVSLVETMLKRHKDLPKAKTPHEQESLKRTIAATDAQIDALVYGLYGLTEDEIPIVGGAT
jgi:type II restriction/modification system DNA methylase subunit YeeA